MSSDQLEQKGSSLPRAERRKFARWFYEQKNEKVGPAGEMEVRAWTIHAGDTAPKAAGVIHSDFERGFIKAETVAYEDLVRLGSVPAARDKGLYRMEGKEDVVKDGDVLLFKFNV